MLDSADAAENKITVELSLVCMWGGGGVEDIFGCKEK